MAKHDALDDGDETVAVFPDAKDRVSTAPRFSPVMAPENSPVGRAGWRSAMSVIGASVLGWASASLEGRRNGIGVGMRAEPKGLREKIGMLAKTVT